MRDMAPVPLPFELGTPMLGGPMTTAGGVAFLTSTMDYYIRAFDVSDGKNSGRIACRRAVSRRR